jgi:hypothetical protein
MGTTNRLLRSLGSGVLGSVALTALHETTRRVAPHPPRMDVIGMRALAAAMRAVGRRPPGRRTLFYETLAGDLVSNALYYALVAPGRGGRSWRRGLALGAAAGVGAVVLPPLLGLGRPPRRRSPETPAMTVALYTVGSLVATAAARALLGGPDDESEDADYVSRRPRTLRD